MTVNAGQQVVLIDYNTYQRTLTTLPPEGLTYFFRDEARTLLPGQVVQENGRNGFDDNFNGLIDERNDSTHINHKYKNYITGQGARSI